MSRCKHDQNLNIGPCPYCENAALRARVAELEDNAKKAWEECHATSSELSAARRERDRWRECAVYLDYSGADYCVAIHKELDGLQADNAGHREQMSRLLNEWRARAIRAEAEAKRYREALETIAAGTSSIEDDGASCDAPCPNSREIARKALEGGK